jgi:hypothetical protein
LTKPFHILDLVRLDVKYFNKSFPDRLAFCLGVRQPAEGGVKLLFCIHTLHVKAHMLIRIEHLLELIFSQQTIVDKYAMEVGSNGMVN